jgi:hypothetical protein
MKSFITYTSIIEALTGLGLLLFPVPLIALLFGSPLDGDSGKIVAWIAGAAILSFALLCFYLRNDPSIRKAVTAMLIYNLLLSLIFLYGLLNHKLSGPGAYLVFIFHSIQTILSVVVIQKRVKLS